MGDDKIIDMTIGAATKAARETVESHAGYASMLAENLGISRVENPDAYARIVAGLSIAMAIDFHTSVSTMAAEKIAASLDRIASSIGD